MNMPRQPAVTLTDEERSILETFVHRGKANARTFTRARILLKSAEGWSTAELAAALSGLQAAHLIAVACSPSPDGHDHWTVRLLAQKAVELGFVKSISPTTIHDLLKKTNSNAGLMNIGVSHRLEGNL
jgi:hypothetical protein